MNRVLYIAQSKEFEKDNVKKNVCQLNTSLYNLVQSERFWFEEIKSKLLAFELKQSKHDETLFYTNELYLTIYLNDIKAFVSINQLIDALSAYLNSKYEMIIKNVTFYLNIKINRHSNEIYLSQIKYIRNLLQKHDMKKCVSASILMIERELIKTSDNYIYNQTHF
jgi:hypothetical protein